MPEHTDPAEFRMRPLDYADLPLGNVRRRRFGHLQLFRQVLTWVYVIPAAIRRHDALGADVPGTPASMLPVAMPRPLPG